MNEFEIDLSLPKGGDINFTYNKKSYIFEIGGKSKTSKQIKNLDNSYIISDDIIIGEKNKIPMWLFGLIK